MPDVTPIPESYPVVTPYLCIDGASEAIAFYTSVFGATERMRMAAPDGKVGHAELDLGGSLIMLADEFPDMGALGPKSIGGSPVTLHVYVDDADAVVERAVAAGATIAQTRRDAVLRRSVGIDRGPIRPCLERSDPCRGRPSRRVGASCDRSDGRAGRVRSGIGRSTCGA